MEFLMLLVAIAAGVWMIPLLRSQPAVALPTLVLVTGVVFGPSFLAIEGPVQISIDRVLWALMIVYAIVCWRLGHVEVPRMTRIDWTILGLSGWLLVSCLRGGEVPDGSSPLARWLFYVALPLGIYAVARVVPLGERDVKWMMRTLFCLGLYLSLTAIFEITGLHALVFPRHIVDPKLWEFFGRGRGPLLNPSGNGIVITCGLVVSAVLFFQAEGRAKALYLASTLLLLAGVYATLTRSVWLGAIVALAVVAMAYTPRWVRVLGLATAVLFAGAAAMGLKDQLLRIKRDKHLTASDAEKSVQLRPLLAIVGWEMFKDRPLIGHGYGHYHEFAGPYHEIRRYDVPLDQARPYMQHNVVLSIAIDAGLIGIVLLLSCLIVWSSYGWDLTRMAGAQPHAQLAGFAMLGTIAAYFVNGMFQDVSVIPMVHMLVWACAGVTVNLRQSLHSFENLTAAPVDRRLAELVAPVHAV